MLTLLLCRDQSDGTREILRAVAQDVAQEKSNTILIVPELISHDMERRLCAAAGDTTSRFAQVLTFTRLADRIAQMAGSGAERCMDNGGRLVAMAAAARSLRGRLKTYACMETKPEFLAELVEAVDEFKRCCIDAQALKHAAEQIALHDSLFAQKLSELALLLESYDAICARGKRDPRDRMNWVLEQLRDGDFAQKHTFYMDGFPDLTRQHMAVLEHLIFASSQVTVCLNCDVPGSRAMAFERAGQTAAELVRIAQALHVPFRVKQIDETDGVLTEMRAMLFQGAIHPLPEAAQAIRLLRAGSVYQECRVAVQAVREWVMQGCRYRDIAIVCTDPAAYTAPLRLAFNRCAIPLYLAGTQDVVQYSVVVTVLSALDAVLDGFEQRDVLRYLRSAMSPLSQQSCDLLENYACIWGISGKRWQEPWSAHPDGLSGVWSEEAEQRLGELNRLREMAITPLLHLANGLKQAVRLDRKIRALYDFLEEIEFAQRLDALATQMQDEGDLRGAQICNQLWEILLTALEQLYDVLGETDWDDAQFSRLLRLLLSQYHVGTIPPVLDAVTAGDVSAMRCQQEKHLIVLGANEGLFPAYSGATGLLTDQERVLLRSLQVPLQGGSLEGMQSEFAEIFGVFCGASCSVMLTCSDEPSFLYRRLLEMTDHTQLDAGQYLLAAQTPMEAAALLVTTGSADAAQRLGIGAEYARIACASGHTLGAVSAQNIKKLYGKQLTLSASQIDRLAECRLSYFLQYGLRAKERKEATVDPAQFGTYVHHVLEHTASEVMRRGGFHKVELQETLDIAHACSREYAAQNYAQLDSQRVEYLFLRNMRELSAVVEELWRELHEAQYTPIRFELSFAENGQLPPIRIAHASMPAQLRGVVDRVDIWEHAGAAYLRVVDYKTGKKDFDYCDILNGVGLQMLLYLFVLEERGNDLVQKPIVPAGVQYFPARVPYLATQSAADEAWEKIRRSQWVRAGLLLDEEDSLLAMTTRERLDMLGCKVDKEGRLVGELADRQRLLLLKRYVMHILSRLVDQIASGDVTPNPYTRGTSHDACAFCPYGSVCHKQSVAQRRDFKAISAQRFWEEIEREMERDGRTID